MSRSAEPSTLVVYNLMQHPLRSTISDHLYAFRRYGTGRTYYLNLAVRDVPGWVAEADFDTVVFHTSFLSQRWIPELFTDQLERASALRGLAGIRVALPQDEFLRAARSTPSSTTWPRRRLIGRPGVGVAEDLRDGGPRARAILTVSHGLPATRPWAGLSDRGADPGADVDVGYRAWRGPAWLGRHGKLKGAGRRRRRRRPAPARGSTSPRARGHPPGRRLVALPGPQPVHGGRRGRRQRSRRRWARSRRAERYEAGTPTPVRGDRGLLPRRGRLAGAVGDLAAAPRGVRYAHLPGARRGAVQRDPRARPALHGAGARTSPTSRR